MQLKVMFNHCCFLNESNFSPAIVFFIVAGQYGFLVYLAGVPHMLAIAIGCMSIGPDWKPRCLRLEGMKLQGRVVGGPTRT